MITREEWMKMPKEKLVNYIMSGDEYQDGDDDE
jgi:hypothetical protein